MRGRLVGFQLFRISGPLNIRSLSGPHQEDTGNNANDWREKEQWGVGVETRALLLGSESIRATVGTCWKEGPEDPEENSRMQARSTLPTLKTISGIGTPGPTGENAERDLFFSQGGVWCYEGKMVPW